MAARAALLSLVCFATLCSAQERVDPRRGAALFETLLQEKEHLSARVYPIRVSLNFNFRFQAGYFLDAPISAFTGSGHSLAVLIRVTPQGKPPVYLGSRYQLPKVPENFKAGGQRLGFGGVFFLGDGEYTVDFILLDDRERIYHTVQKIHTKRTAAERQMKNLLEPGMVMSLSGLRVLNPNPSDAKPLKLTLLLHAAPNFARSTVFRTQDLSRLLGAMTGLLEQVPVKSLRVVAFNLDQQKELYRNGMFDASGFEKLQQTLMPVQLGTVDIRVLKNPRGYVDLLAGMISQELHEPEVSEAVIVLGPPSRLLDSVRSGAIESNPGAGPKFFYFQYHSPRDIGQPQYPDTIESAMKRVGGKIFRIFTASDFAKAIADLKKTMAGA